jgi:hypothetical protein
MRAYGMPGTVLVVAQLLLLVHVGAGCIGSTEGTHAEAPRPLGLPDDFDLEADRRSVLQPRSGGGAIVDRVRLSLRNRSDRPRELAVTGVDRLHGSCDALGWDDVRALTVHEPSRPVKIAPAEGLDLAVTFEPVECYNACDRFGFRVHVELDGQPVVVDSLLDVERDEAAR